MGHWLLAQTLELSAHRSLSLAELLICSQVSTSFLTLVRSRLPPWMRFAQRDQAEKSQLELQPLREKEFYSHLRHRMRDLFSCAFAAAGGSLLETLLGGFFHCFWPDPRQGLSCLLESNFLLGSARACFWQTSRGIVYCIPAESLPPLWRALAQALVLCQAQEAWTVLPFDLWCLREGEGLQRLFIIHAKLELPAAWWREDAFQRPAREIWALLESARRPSGEPDAFLTQCWQRRGTTWSSQSAAQFISSALQDPDFPWRASLEGVFEYLVRRGVTRLTLQAYVDMWRGAKGCLPLFCADCLEWLAALPTPSRSAPSPFCYVPFDKARQIPCTLLAPEQQPCTFRAVWPTDARREDLQKRFFGASEEKRQGSWACQTAGAGRWLWTDLSAEVQPAPWYQFHKLCAARRCPPVSHFPFGARLSGDPLEPKPRRVL